MTFRQKLLPRISALQNVRTMQWPLEVIGILAGCILSSSNLGKRLTRHYYIDHKKGAENINRFTEIQSQHAPTLLNLQNSIVKGVEEKM